MLWQKAQTAKTGHMRDENYHVPVLLKEAIGALNLKPGGVYVDCTFGGGGHSKAILENLGPDGKLFAFDQDEDAKQNLPEDQRVLFIPQNFRFIGRFLKLHQVNTVDGILADLGVSSHQFDEAGRGFSTRFNAALDMRMDQKQPVTAIQVIEQYSEEQLHKIFEQYGEVTNARTLARTIVQVRNTVSLKSVDAFKTAIRGVVKGNPNKYFAQVFQALRIEVNDEIGALRDLLLQIPSLLNTGGRAVFITFHSIEDRLVKNFFRYGAFEQEDTNPFEMTPAVKKLKVITRKPVEASGMELKKNPRARSARMRVAEKIEVSE